MVFPLLPFYAQHFGATPLQLGFLAASFSITQFLVSPIVGRISDRYGRKPVLVVALLGTAGSFVAFGLAPSLFWLFIARAVHGLFSSGVFPIAAAYIGDSTSKEERVTYMSRLTATFALGFIVGPAASGLLAGFAPAFPFVAAGILAFLNATFIFFFLRESLTAKAEKLVLKEGLVNVKAILHGFRGEFGTLFFMLFAWAFALANLEVGFPLFAEQQLSFHEQQIGVVFAWMGSVAAFVQWVFLPFIVKKFGEFRTIIAGGLGMAAGQALISYAPNLGILFLFVSVSTLGSALMRPTVNALLSKGTREGQGTTMGLAFSFESLGRVIGPLVGGFLINAAGIHSQFLLGALFLIGSSLFFAKSVLVTKTA